MVQTFNHSQFGALRTMVMNTNIDGQEVEQTWFVGKDVASALGYADQPKSIKMHVDDQDKLTRQIVVSGQRRQVILINESGLYALVINSKLPQAREFKHWVTSEVLPSIRRSGGYMMATPQMSAEEIMARAALLAKETIERLQTKLTTQQQQIEAERPLVKFAEAVSSSEASILIRDLAKLLTQNGVKIGQNRLFYWLRLKGYLFQNETRPIQKWVEQGLFDTQETIIDTHHGQKVRLTTKVTGKGQRYFIEGFTSGRFSAQNGEFH